MSLTQRFQAAHSRLRSHFGSVSVTIRDGVASGATEMVLQCSTPVSGSVVTATGAVEEHIVKFDHSDPLRTFIPSRMDPISWTTPTAFNGRIREVRTHVNDGVTSYTLVCGGTQ